jgi:phosphoglycerate dehydrogenase-like enzyme
VSSVGPATVVVTYPGFDPGDARTAGRLRAAGHQVRLEPRLHERTPADVRAFMADAAAGIVSTDPFDASVFAGCPQLRVLARVGVGIDTIDLAAATRAGVAVTITPGLNAATVADHTLSLILACCRRLLENDRSLRAGAWNRGRDLNGIDLTGTTVGIVGLGDIGRAVARRLAGFDVEIVGSDPAGASWDGVRLLPLDELLAVCDVVTLHVPLVVGTRSLIGARELALMRRGAILVNTARGGVVDERALLHALRDGHLAGAGIDVFAQEPPGGSPLLKLPNVVVSPHIAGISVGTQQAMLESAVDAVLAVLAGDVPGTLINPDALAGVGGREPQAPAAG